MSALRREEAALRAADAAARLAAQREFGRPFVLEAGAGTGKTTVLVARVVAWLLGPGWARAEARLADARPVPAPDEAPGPEDVAADALRRVVALTFTEAAAAEMASRIGEALLEVEAGRIPRGVREEALPAPEARPARARALVAGLDQLVVRTIHAWCRRLLAAQPLEAGLHPGFEVDADGRRTAEVVRDVLERELARAWAEPGDSDHRALAADGRGPAELEEALLALLDAGMPAEGLAASPFAPAALRGLHAALTRGLEDFLVAEAGSLAAVRGAPVAQRTAEALSEARVLCLEDEPGDAAGLARHCKALRELCGPSQRERLRRWGRGDFGTRENEALGDRAAAVAERARVLAPLLDHCCALDPEALERARRVLHPLLSQVEAELRRRGVESFEALLQDARALLEERPAAAARVRGEIDQLLVDEFQDTDRTQCAILAALVLDAPAGAERPGLFLVGDPKQSIYGWRNADLAAYDDFVVRVRREDGRFERLSVSFRAAPPLLREVDRVVAPVMDEVPRRQPPFEPLVAAPERARDPGFDLGGRRPVEHWVSWTSEKGTCPETRPRVRDAAELEARAVAREIAALHREHGVPWSHVALLFRALTDVEIYLEALREAGVPYVVERDRSYYERREVIEAGAVVRCVLDPRDQVALVAFLRSAWVGVPDAALVPLWKRERLGLLGALRGRSPQDLAAARQAVRAAAREVPDDLPGLERLAGWEHALLHAVEVLDGLRGSHERDAPDVFVEKLRGLLVPEASEAARYLGLHRLANLDRFFRDLVAALEESGGDVGAVLANLRTVSVAREAAEGRPRDAAGDAVSVLSVHKAKGLDFEQVFLGQLHKEAGADPPKARAALGEAGWEYTLFGWPTPGFHASAREAEAVDEAERVRTLYVALTRARRRLVLCGVRSGLDRRKPPGDARSHAQLLDARTPETPDLEELFAEAVVQGRDWSDAAETRWSFPVLRTGSDAPAASAPSDPSVAADPRAEIEALARCRAAARERESRSFSGVASREEPRLAVEAVVDAREAGEGEGGRRAPRLPRELAQAVGTALHGALEDLDLEDSGPTQRSACLERAGSLLGMLVAPDDREAALARVRELLDHFWGGSLHDRLRALAPHVIARELPVLLAPEPEGGGPTGFVAGAVDLLYRDPASRELVVADYKTDAVSGEDELAEKAARYRGQGELYVRAVQQALELDRPPRFELWFLDTGHIREVPLSS